MFAITVQHVTGPGSAPTPPSPPSAAVAPPGFASVLAQQVGGGAATFAAAARAPSATLGEMLRLTTFAGAVAPAASAGLAAHAGVSALAGPATAGAPAASGGATLLRPVEARMSSDFGPRVHPVTGQHKHHAGVDFAAPTGTPIRAAAAGTVSFAGVRGGYGNLVIVDHADGSQTYYAHQHRLGVRAGEQVGRGQQIGIVGSTGLSTGPHLHFELRRDGHAVDPAPALGL